MTGPGYAPRPGAEIAAGDAPARDPIAALRTLVGCPDLASRRWIWEQYDHLVMGQTVQRPGGDAAVVRMHGRRKALALTTDCTPRYCDADPEARRRAGGGRELAQPDRRRRPAAGDHRQHEFRQSRKARDHGPVRRRHRGHARRPAWRSTIPSSPAMSRSTTRPNGSGILADAGDRRRRRARRCGASAVSLALQAAGRGDPADRRDAGPSRRLALSARDRWGARTARRRRSISPPSAATAISSAARSRPGRVSACHDVSDGGLLVALAEMAMAGGIGAAVRGRGRVPRHAFWFGEDQARYLVATAAARGDARPRPRAPASPAQRLGLTGGDG